MTLLQSLDYLPNSKQLVGPLVAEPRQPLVKITASRMFRVS